MVRKTNNSMAVAFDEPAYATPMKHRDASVDSESAAEPTPSKKHVKKASVKNTPAKTSSVGKTSISKPPTKAAVNKASVNKTPAKSTPVNAAATKTALKAAASKVIATKPTATNSAPTKKFSKATGRELPPMAARKIRKKPSNSAEVAERNDAFAAWLKENDTDDDD